MIEENVEWKEKKAWDENQKYKNRNNCLKLAWILWRQICE